MKCEKCQEPKSECWFRGKRVCKRCWIIMKFDKTKRIIKLKKFDKKEREEERNG